MLPVRDWLYLAAILVLITGGVYLREHLIDEGEAKANARAAKAAAEQKQKDDDLARVVLGGLNGEIARLHAVADTPPPRVYAHPCPLPARPPAAGAPDASPSGGSLPEVSVGTGSGPDLGPSLQRLALDADILSAQDRAKVAYLKGSSP